MNANPRIQDLVVTRVLDALVEHAWRAWHDPAYVMQWWGPNGFTCPLAKIDFKVGGTSLVCMRAPKEFGGQDMFNTWTYEEIVPQERIVYVLRFADKHGNATDPAEQGLPAGTPGEVRNEVAFKALEDDRTEVRVTEYGWPAGPMTEMSRLGLEQCLDKMAALYAIRPVGRAAPDPECLL